MKSFRAPRYMSVLISSRSYISDVLSILFLMQPENTNKKGVAWFLEPTLFPSFPFWKEGGSGDVVVMNFRINLYLTGL